MLRAACELAGAEAGDAFYTSTWGLRPWSFARGRWPIGRRAFLYIGHAPDPVSSPAPPQRESRRSYFIWLRGWTPSRDQFIYCLRNLVLLSVDTIINRLWFVIWLMAILYIHVYFKLERVFFHLSMVSVREQTVRARGFDLNTIHNCV